MMVKNKGHFICKQYVGIKPKKGFKLWVLCDLANGYFLFIEGGKGEAVSNKGLRYSFM